MLKRPVRRALIAVCGAAVIVLPGTPAAVAAPAPRCSTHTVDSSFHEHQVFTEIVPDGPIPTDVTTVPNWTGQFSVAGKSYPYTMVGTDPAAGSATTSVPVVIVPLRLVFASDGCVIEDASMADDVTASPLFTPTRFATGTDQYVDAIQRGNFWSDVSTTSPDYHLQLVPAVTPVQTLRVPASQGVTVFDTYTNREAGAVGGHWLSNQLNSLLASLQVPPTSLAVFLTYNTAATDDNPSSCLTDGCFLYDGFHSAEFNGHNPHAINTVVWASFTDYGDSLPPHYNGDVYTLSHELLEWANDPFVHGARVAGQMTATFNLVPPWVSPYYPGCWAVLEVGDAVEDGGPIILATPRGGSAAYLLADAAFLSWFARQSPSTAIGGRYDAAGVLTSYSQGC